MNESIDYSALTKDELDEFQKANIERINELEEEIFLLEKSLKQYGPGGLSEPGLNINSFESEDELKERLIIEIDKYVHRLAETANLTGVVIESIDRHVISLDTNHCIKQFHLELQILDRKVLVTYKLQENLLAKELEQDLNQNKLAWFEVKFTEDINNAIGSDVTKAVEKLAIYSTFSLLKSYIQWLNLHDSTLKSFLKDFPENVTMSFNEKGQTCLKIQCNKPNRPTFIVEWGRKVVTDRVEDDIKLVVEASEEMLEMDTKNVLASSPKVFHGLVEALGPKKAIASLIQLVATDGKGA